MLKSASQLPLFFLLKQSLMDFTTKTHPNLNSKSVNFCQCSRHFRRTHSTKWFSSTNYLQLIASTLNSMKFDSIPDGQNGSGLWGMASLTRSTSKNFFNFQNSNFHFHFWAFSTGSHRSTFKSQLSSRRLSFECLKKI